jgi:hypothetical protein
MSESLKDILLASGQTVYGVASRAGTPPGHLYNILNRVRRPLPPLAKAIERASNGVIRAVWLLELEPAPDGHLGDTFPEAS